MRLTVAIPTFNRNEILLRTLGSLLPQLRDDCRLLILDNCSDVPVADTLASSLADHPHLDVRIVRNRTNIGGSANLVRCFELCETPWLWTLGDDDQVLPDAIETILRNIDQQPECVYFNFAYDDRRRTSIHTRGLEEFVARLDASSNIGFLSTGVWRLAPFLPHLRFAYHFAYTLSPHVALLLVALGDSSLCCYSRERILGNPWVLRSSEQQWSMITFGLGLPTLFDLQLPGEVRAELAHKLLWPFGGQSLPLPSVVYQLLMMIANGRTDAKSALYFYDQICSRWYYFDPHPLGSLKRLALRMLLLFPGAGIALVRLRKRMTGQVFGSDAIPDRFSRW